MCLPDLHTETPVNHAFLCSMWHVHSNPSISFQERTSKGMLLDANSVIAHVGNTGKIHIHKAPCEIRGRGA